MRPEVDVSVVVLSYDRPQLLERALAALRRPQVRGDLELELLIVDNHPDRLAEAIVARFASGVEFPVRYLADPRRNYAIVRNLGVKAGRGRYVAFLDDDEEPQDGWLEALVSCLERTGADAAFGRKLPVFETGAAPDWDPQGRFFKTDREEPQDAEIRMFSRLRRPNRGLGAGNSIYRAATCFVDGEPIPPRFGVGGGEDTYLLFKLAAAGRRFVWCPSAVVLEFMEAQRIRPSYILTRLRRGSQHYASRRVALSRRPLCAALRVTGLGLAQLAVHAGLYLVTRPLSRPAGFAHRVGVAKGLGKLTWLRPIGFIDEHRA